MMEAMCDYIGMPTRSDRSRDVLARVRPPAPTRRFLHAQEEGPCAPPARARPHSYGFLHRRAVPSSAHAAGGLEPATRPRRDPTRGRPDARFRRRLRGPRQLGRLLRNLGPRRCRRGGGARPGRSRKYVGCRGFGAGCRPRRDPRVHRNGRLPFGDRRTDQALRSRSGGCREVRITAPRTGRAARHDRDQQTGIGRPDSAGPPPRLADGLRTKPAQTVPVPRPVRLDGGFFVPRPKISQSCARPIV
jgi:hypothetical protein